MKIEQSIYERTSRDAAAITKISTELAFLSNIMSSDVVNQSRVRENYEDSRRRDIKNLISNIYLVLDLHEVKGIADQIFDKNFTPVE